MRPAEEPNTSDAFAHKGLVTQPPGLKDKRTPCAPDHGSKEDRLAGVGGADQVYIPALPFAADAGDGGRHACIGPAAGLRGAQGREYEGLPALIAGMFERAAVRVGAVIQPSKHVPAPPGTVWPVPAPRHPAPSAGLTRYTATGRMPLNSTAACSHVASWSGLTPAGIRSSLVPTTTTGLAPTMSRSLGSSVPDTSTRSTSSTTKALAVRRCLSEGEERRACEGDGP